MKRLILLSSTALLVAGTAFYGCKKNADSLVNGAATDKQTAIDNQVAESASKDAGNMCTAASKAKSEGRPDFRVAGGFAPGVKITDSTSNGFKYLICDFRKVAQCGDGITRTGIIRARWTDSASYDKAVLKTIDFIGYVYKGYAINGTVTITKGTTAGSVTVMADVTLKKDTISTLKSTVTQVLLEEHDSTTAADNVYQITGSATGINSKGISYTTTITKPLIKDMTCAYFMQGRIDYVINGKGGTYIDFGDRKTGCHHMDTVYVNNQKILTDISGDH